MARTGRPAHERARIIAYAEEMRASGHRVNKSRIARELHVHISTVFRTLPRISLR